jgi:hypothetical protein
MSPSRARASLYILLTFLTCTFSPFFCKKNFFIKGIDLESAGDIQDFHR